MKLYIWLIVLLVGIPQFSETVYSPSLPDVSNDLKVSESMVEFTLTIYLIAFAVGILFWGILSDKYGRKPCIITGLLIFIIGCLGCYFSDNISELMISRFIQAFGGSIGSVLGQAVCRDAFKGPALGKVYSTVGASLAIFPAVGPVVGGFIAAKLHWSDIFIFLTMCGIILTLLVIFLLPETHKRQSRSKVSVVQVCKLLMKDRKVIGLGVIISGCNGMYFSYFAEGPFYFIELLRLSPIQYGNSFLLLAASSMVGGLVSKKLNNTHYANEIIEYGIITLLISMVILSSLVIFHSNFGQISNDIIIVVTIGAAMLLMFGICMVNSNALAIALIDYKDYIGTASSIFGAFYSLLTSIITLGMGLLHNGTLTSMPLYFLGISIVIIFMSKVIVKS